jgi:HSP20 family protein
MIEVILRHHPISQDWFSNETLTGNNEVQRWRYQHRQGVWRPLTDVYENEEAIVVRVEIGGMREEDFSILLEERRLLIQGNRSDAPERRAFYQMEIPYGEFSTEIELPIPVAVEGVTAIYRDGFLKVVLPKARSHLIQIKES